MIAGCKRVIAEFLCFRDVAVYNAFSADIFQAGMAIITSYFLEPPDKCKGGRDM